MSDLGWWTVLDWMVAAVMVAWGACGLIWLWIDYQKEKEWRDSLRK